MKAMGRKAGTVYFTSGGTEADSMAIFGTAMARKRRGRGIVTSKVEHPAVLEAVSYTHLVCWKENGKSSVSVDSAAEKNRRNCIAGPWRSMEKSLRERCV